MNIISDYLTIILGAFIGSFFSFYFSRRKFQKDKLYTHKVEAYREIINKLIELRTACFKQSDLKYALNIYMELRTQLDKSLIFMPDKVYKKFTTPISTAASKLGAYLGIENEEGEKLYFLFPKDKKDEIKEIVWNPDKLFPLVDIFSPIINEIPNMIGCLKSDIGTEKTNNKKGA